jgi:hypothetical protein
MNCDELTLPTADLVLAACRKFDKENEVVEQALQDLFGQYRSNHYHPHVLLKVVALNALYSTRIFVFSEKVPSVLDVARHIHEHAQELDSALSAGSPEIVDTIAMVTVLEKKDRNYFSFATKYCSWHNPVSYPIWDSNVERYLGCLQKQTGFAKDFNMNAQWKYPIFHAVMHRFRDCYDLGSFSFKEIDKFLWLCGGKSSGMAAGQS